MIALKDVNLQLGAFSLSHLNLDIHAKETFGLIGPSGSGKSTLLRTINGIQKIDSGEILIDGSPIHTFNQRQLLAARRSIGMIFQQFNLFLNYTALENVRFPLDLAGISSGEANERARECLKQVGLLDRAHHYPAQLSGGQKQRVAIARAIANRPKILLADEPTSALDPRSKREVIDALQELREQHSLTIVLVTHELDIAQTLCDRVAFLDQGHLRSILLPNEVNHESFFESTAG